MPRAPIAPLRRTPRPARLPRPDPPRRRHWCRRHRRARPADRSRLRDRPGRSCASRPRRRPRRPRTAPAAEPEAKASPQPLIAEAALERAAAEAAAEAAAVQAAAQAAADAAAAQAAAAARRRCCGRRLARGPGDGRGRPGKRRPLRLRRHDAARLGLLGLHRLGLPPARRLAAAHGGRAALGGGQDPSRRGPPRRPRLLGRQPRGDLRRRRDDLARPAPGKKTGKYPLYGSYAFGRVL